MALDSVANRRTRIAPPLEDAIPPADLDRLRTAGFAYVMTAPIVTDDAAYGTATFFLVDDLPPSEEVLEFVAAMARQIAVVVRDRSIRLQQDRSSRYLAALLDVTQAAIAGSDLHQLLDHIARAREMGLAYVYLGYWVQGSRKMDYKGRFMPQERLMPDGWTRVEA